MLRMLESWSSRVNDAGGAVMPPASGRTTAAPRAEAPGGTSSLPEPQMCSRRGERQLIAASPISLYSPFSIWYSHMPPWMPMWSSAE